MDQRQKFSFCAILSLGIYFTLTFPMFLAFFTMDINGEYIGIVYPTWLCITLGVLSSILGTIAGKYYIKKNKL